MPSPRDYLYSTIRMKIKNFIRIFWTPELVGTRVSETVPNKFGRPGVRIFRIIADSSDFADFGLRVYPMFL